MVVINGFAVTATVIVTGGPVYVAPDAAAAAVEEPAAAGVDAAADAALGVGADDVAVLAAPEDVVPVALLLLLPHPARTIEPTDSKATSDTMPLRRL
jgi:hypothetical protein